MSAKPQTLVRRHVRKHPGEMFVVIEEIRHEEPVCDCGCGRLWETTTLAEYKPPDDAEVWIVVFERVGRKPTEKQRDERFEQERRCEVLKAWREAQTPKDDRVYQVRDADRDR